MENNDLERYIAKTQIFRWYWLLPFGAFIFLFPYGRWIANSPNWKLYHLRYQLGMGVMLYNVTCFIILLELFIDLPWK